MVAPSTHGRLDPRERPGCAEEGARVGCSAMGRRAGGLVGADL